jgi:Zn-dependent peptidase ImmA (M78 family)
LAHEFKHILDHRFVDVLYADIPDAERHHAVELICEYFAGCLLMPRPWLKAAWCDGVQDTRALAQRFETSELAIRTRLHQIGLSAAQPRCSYGRNDWGYRSVMTRPDRPKYSRPLERTTT